MRLTPSFLFGLAVALVVIGVPTQLRAECPDAQSVCGYWPIVVVGIPGEVTAWCEGPACFDKTYLSEAQIVAVDDEGLFPTTFKVKASGELTNISCVEPVETVGKKDKATIKIPETRHCSISQQTDSDSYLWLISSDPSTGCLGIVECRLLTQ